MPATSSWESVALGLNLKLVAMWLILPSIIFPFVLPSYLGLLFAALVPLSIDLVGRCYCARAPVPERHPIKISIIAQGSGVFGLTFLSISLGLGGVILGLVWAAVFQASAAKWFIKYLRAIALDINQPEIAAGMDQLRQRLIATTLSSYGVGVIALFVLTCAVVLGLMAYGIGLLLTLPLAFLMIMPLVITCMLLYFFMLYSYEKSLTQLKQAIYAHCAHHTSAVPTHEARDS